MDRILRARIAPRILVLCTQPSCGTQVPHARMRGIPGIVLWSDLTVSSKVVNHAPPPPPGLGDTGGGKRPLEALWNSPNRYGIPQTIMEFHNDFAFSMEFHRESNSLWNSIMVWGYSIMIWDIP